MAPQVSDLPERLDRDRHNSSQPPSSDGFKRPPRSPRQLSGKKPGAPPGHPGHTLRFNPHPDRVVTHRPAACAQCGQDLHAIPATTSACRQVVDLPPLALETGEHRCEQVCCPACGRANSAPFPAEAVEPGQYGPRLQALGVYLGSYQLLPYERSSELLTDLFGAAPSVGTLAAATQAAAAALAPVAEQIRTRLQAADVIHCDETGLNVGGKRWWWHVVSTARWTLYHAHQKRGQEASKEMGVLPEFQGTAMHDNYASYGIYPCQHALCNAHHLRELSAVEEQGGQEWAGQMKNLLVSSKGAVSAARESGPTGLAPEVWAAYEAPYQGVITAGLALNPVRPPPAAPQRGRVKPSKAYNLRVRLRDHAAEVLRFMTDLRVPFDNNPAERDLRMAQVQQKISGCFRSPEGAQAFSRIRGYISTLRKQGIHVFTALEQVFRGDPTLPSLSG